MIWPAVLLAWIAGFVDAVGYLVLGNVFTAHMSGNSAAFGAHLGAGNWAPVLVRIWAIGCFIFGIVAGVLCHWIARKKRWRSQMSPALTLEIILLAGLIGLQPGRAAAGSSTSQPRIYIGVALLATAMGLQNATLRRVGGLRVRTTYISGMLTNMAENAARFLIRRVETRNGRLDRETARFAGRAFLYGLIFASFVAGAVSGGLGAGRWSNRAVVAPIAALVILTIANLKSPLHDQNRKRVTDNAG